MMIKKVKGAMHNPKRKGRGPGNGKGCTAGRGNNGQNSRSGGGVRVGFEGGQMPLYRRVARRGFSNHAFKRNITELNIAYIEQIAHVKSDDKINISYLIEKNIVGKNVELVKFIGNIKMTKKLYISDNKILFTQGARKALLAAGGEIKEEQL